MFFFPGRLLAAIFRANWDERQQRNIGLLALLPLFYVLLMLVLFALLVAPNPSSSRAEPLTILLCGSPLLVVAFSALAIAVIALQKPSATATRSSFSIREAAEKLHMSETDVLSMITSGRLRARKRDGEYRIDREILDLFSRLPRH